MGDMMKHPKATQVCRLFASISTIRTNRPLTNYSDQSESEESQEEDVKDLNQNKPVSSHTPFCIAVLCQLTPYELKRLSLLRLPAEIRNKIYRLVLVDVLVPQRVIPSLAPPPLTLVNKQILAEVLPIYYAENIFYLLLWGKPRRLGGQDPAQFHRFARMAEYFGRQTTSPTDNSPMRHIKNIIVQVADTTAEAFEIFFSVTLGELSSRRAYKKLCIRSEQQQVTYTSDSEIGEKAFDPIKYCWTVGNATSPNGKNPWFLHDALHLTTMSFNGRMELMEESLRRLQSEAKRTGRRECALVQPLVAYAPTFS